MTNSAIIFDCDGVLVDSERIAIAVEREHLGRIGLFYDATEYLSRFVGLTNEDFHDALDSDHQTLNGSPLPPSFFGDLKAACRAR